MTIGAPIAATDPEMDTLNYVVDDTTNFSIGLTTGQLSLLNSDVALDYEATPPAMPKRTYTLMVTVHDDDPTGIVDDTITVTVNVINVNEPPMFGTTTTDAYVYAGKIGNVVHDPEGVFIATDPDENDTLIYRLTSGTENFRIDSGTGVLETTKVLTTTPTTQSVTVTATDRAGRFDDQTFAITVQATTKTAKPVFTSTGAITYSVAENTLAPANIDSPVTAGDGDGDKVTYSLGGTDGTSFDIDSDTGQLRVKDPLDFETKSRYTVIVKATDGTSTVEKPVTITVNDVDEAPVFTEGTTATRTIPETPVGTLFAPANVGAPVVATDDDGHTVAYMVTGANFSIVPNTGQLRTQSPGLDHESASDGIYSVTITATSAGGDASITVTITATDLNDKPKFVGTDGTTEIFSATRTVAENTPKGTLINAAVTAIDEDDETLTYSLQSADASRFDIESTSGQLITKAVLDFEATPQKRTFTVTVRADDGRGGRSDLPVIISLTDANDRPMFSGPSITREVKESETAIDVGDPVVATDPEADATADGISLAYTHSGPDALFFTIEGTTGQLKTRAADPGPSSRL